MQALPNLEFRVSIIAIVVIELAALIARSALEVELTNAGVTSQVAKDLSFLVVPPILIVLLFPYLVRCKTSLLTLFRPASLTFRVVVLSALLGITLRVTRWSVLTLLIAFGFVRNNDSDAVMGPILGFVCPSWQQLLLGFTVMSVLVPIVEEIVNRGFILHALLPRGKPLAVIVSAFLFALMHDPGTYLTAFIIGIFFAIQVINYQTLWAPVVAHTAYNAMTILDWRCTQLIWNPPPGDTTMGVLAAISLPIAVIATAVSMFLVSEKAAGANSSPRPL